jgi:hypothetical protein
MTCIRCHHGQTNRFGYVGKRRIQRYRCTFCNTTFVEPRPKPLDNHYLPLEKAILIGQLGHAAMYGPQASFFAELFPAKVRYSGASLGYQFASIFAGGMALPVATALVAWADNKTWPVSLYMISFVIITIIAVICAEETYKKVDVS